MPYKNKADHAAYMREWRKRNPLSPDQKVRDTARSKANVYLKRGKIQRAEACSICGYPHGLEMHHHNGYEGAAAYDIQWLCRPCHGWKHGRIRKHPE